MAFLPKLVYISNTLPIKIPADLFADIDSLNLKFVWKYKGLQIAKAILKKKNDTGGISVKPGYKAIAIRTYFIAIK